MRNRWFETVAVAQDRAKRRLPASVYGAIIAGAEAGVTMRQNTAAFDEIGLLPVAAGQSSDHDLSTAVMGQQMPMPVMVAPAGVQAVHPDGEVAVARAAAARGLTMGLSSFASRPLAEVVAANPRTLLQLYWSGDRSSMLARLQRARECGVSGIIVTLDWSFSHGRDWGSPRIPQSVSLETAVRHLPEVVCRPRWLAAWLRSGTLPDLRVPNAGIDGADAPLFFEAYGSWMATAPPKWEDVAWLRSQWDGPFMVKGVCRTDDARQAVDLGATAISVSNHGGNNLDSQPAAIRVLPSVVEAVGDQIEVILDGGVRRGSDVVKAVALGARAVMLGRATLWGLAAGGQAGVENVFDLIRAGIESTMRGLGHRSLDQLSPSDLVIPPSFMVEQPVS